MQKLQEIFPYTLIAFIVGVGIASLTDNPWIWCIITLSSSFFLAIYWLFTGRPVYMIAVILLALGSLGALRYAVWMEGVHGSVLEAHVGERVHMTALVVDEPDERETSTHLTVLPSAINGQSLPAHDDARLLLFLPRYPEFRYGDVLRIEGVLKAPLPFGDEGKREFNYPMFLSSKNIHALMFFGTVRVEEHGRGNQVIASLFHTKQFFLSQLSEVYAEPHGALLSGLILGGKQSLGAEWIDIFKRAGVIHIVVLSGYNMTIVSQWLVTMFRFLGFYGSLSVGALGIVLFAIMTGAGATVVRAAIMAIIALLARATGRTYTMGRALLLAGVCMVIHNPSILLFDPSFQLSFLASLGLIFVSPVLDVHIKILKQFRALREVVISTIATQVMVLPLLLYQTGVMSLVALPVNFLVLPIIPLTMLFGFLSGVVAVFIPPLAGVVALPAQFFLSYILGVSRLGASIPYATVNVQIGWVVLTLLYVLLFVTLWYAHRRVAGVTESLRPPSPGDKAPSSPMEN